MPLPRLGGRGIVSTAGCPVLLPDSTCFRSETCSTALRNVCYADAPVSLWLHCIDIQSLLFKHVNVHMKQIQCRRRRERFRQRDGRSANGNVSWITSTAVFACRRRRCSSSFRPSGCTGVTMTTGPDREGGPGAGLGCFEASSSRLSSCALVAGSVEFAGCGSGASAGARRCWSAPCCTVVDGATLRCCALGDGRLMAEAAVPAPGGATGASRGVRFCALMSASATRVHMMNSRRHDTENADTAHRSSGVQLIPSTQVKADVSWKRGFQSSAPV